MIKERIRALIEALGVSGREFCRSIDQSESWNRLIGNSIGSDVVGKIMRTYPQINSRWLILGEGEMFGKNEVQTLHEEESIYLINNNYKNICEELRADNKELRVENKKLRETVLGLMYKNEQLMIENSQLKAKTLQ